MLCQYNTGAFLFKLKAGTNNALGVNIMKAEKLYQELKDLAEKLGIEVSVQSFRTTGVKARSGFCRVRNQDRCILDKNARLPDKIDALIECISRFPHEAVYVVPAVREVLRRSTQTHASAAPMIPDEPSDE